MRQLRLVGVHEDGEHLLLSDEDGSSFGLRIDEALRSAAARPIGRPASTASGEAAAKLSPREIQARIRGGATAEEVAEQSGLPLAHVQRYEGPVRAERDYIAQQARGVEVSGPQGNDGYRSTFGDDPATLGDMVAHRLHSFGVDPESLEWDAWRRSDGAWEVVAAFEASGGDSRSNIGEEPPARWVYQPARKALQNSNRWAQVLSELETLDYPLAGRRLTAVADRPFDFETDAEDGEQPAEDPALDGTEAEELLDVLRSRRGQRLGADEDADDALALLLSRGGIPAAHPRDEDFVDEAEARRLGMVVDAEADDADADDAGLPHLHDGVSTETSEFTVVPGLRAVRFDGPQDDHHDGPAGDIAERGPEDDEPQPRRSKAKRSSVPSWDEIVFGRKHD